MWTIKFDNGKWAYIDPGYIAQTRSSAWRKWEEGNRAWKSSEITPQAKRNRRKGFYRAVRIAIVEVPAKEQP